MASGSSSAVSVLIVEDEPGLREGLAAAIATLGYRALTAAGIAEARTCLERSFEAQQEPDCILLDIRLKDGDGLDFLSELRAGPKHHVPVIIATAYGDSERTIRAMRDGAFDYLTKPFQLPVLLETVERAVKQRALARTITVPQVVTEKGLIGTSAAMLGIWKLIGRAAASTAPVLITGETGVGKELVARAIHDYSIRASDAFIAVNLAALPPTLIESELFGHEKGAFTGANARRSGRFELSAAGTLFLDEIGDLDIALQTKLLRVLQDGSYERVGGGEVLTSRARIIAATNRPVRPNEPNSVLREDLYYRLAVIDIEVPPLRARKSDIPLLVAHALKGTPARAASEQAMEALTAYDWPGNVRELVHVIERAAVLGGEIIDITSLPENVRTGAGSSRMSAVPASASPPSQSQSQSQSQSLRDAIAILERKMIIEALERAKGNRSEAARQLGIGRPQLYAKMEEHGISGGGGVSGQGKDAKD